jgi:hypothetical protein
VREETNRTTSLTMILGVCIFYDDGADMLRRSLTSLKAVTDRVLAIDGAYAEFPHKDFLSQKSTSDIAKELADEVITPDRVWKDEVEKRNAYLKLKSEKDYYFMLDADEVVEGGKPMRLVHPTYRISLSTLKDGNWFPYYYNRLFRHHRGMRYHLKHNNLITKQGISLSIPDDNIPIHEGLVIKHYAESRPRERQVADGFWENNKAERKIVLPTQKTPACELSWTPVRLRYNGDKVYNGFDSKQDGSSNDITCRRGDLIYVTEAKAKQLQSDFPNDWVFIKEL